MSLRDCLRDAVAASEMDREGRGRKSCGRKGEARMIGGLAHLLELMLKKA
jgi:hypothetical protein